MFSRLAEVLYFSYSIYNQERITVKLYCIVIPGCIVQLIPKCFAQFDMWMHYTGRYLGCLIDVPEYEQGNIFKDLSLL